MGSGSACACALLAALDGTKEEERFERLARVRMGLVREVGQPRCRCLGIRWAGVCWEQLGQV